MATKVVMPQLGESVVEGTVTEWLIQEGEKVEEFEPLVEINTDKVDTEVPAPASGVLLKVYVQAGETVEAGRLLAVIGKEGEQVPAAEGGEPAKTEPAAKKAPATAASQESVSPGRQEGLGFISPVVARMASEHNLDLSQIEGSGRDGRITKQDVRAYLESQKEAPEAAPWEQPASGELFRPSEEVFGVKSKAEVKDGGEVKPLDPVRRSIAEHMVRSKHTSPHVTTVMEADLQAVVNHRSSNKESFAQEGINLTYSAYFAAAAIQALKEIPLVNSAWVEEGILLHDQVNLGMAVSLGERGLIVPVIRQAESRSLRGLAQAINDLAERARQGKLDPEEVQGGTFTITNHGTTGSLMATPIINQPQCAILGVGAVQKRVTVMEAESAQGETVDSIVIRPMVYLTLTFDHRIIDGAIADHFLGRIVERLESWS
ncbi:MAG: dihydrolipoamide acetyltransferase family protein [Anaerolineales bacterium]